MLTRFDTLVWTTARGEVLTMKEMETDHLLNTLKMLAQKPTVVVSMLIKDAESLSMPHCCTPWTKDQPQNVIAQSIHSITSMTAEEVCNYALDSCLGQAIQSELMARGVNINCYLTLLGSPE